MIKNDWQLRVTQKRIKDFEDALFELSRLPESNDQPWLRTVQRESLESELNNLRRQVEEYELLKAGKIALPGAEVVQQLPELLIKTRISKGLNQEALAARLGVSKQCIQQYEQTNYAHVTLSVVQKIMQVLVEDSTSVVTTPIAKSQSAKSMARIEAYRPEESTARGRKSATDKKQVAEKKSPVPKARKKMASPKKGAASN